VGGRAYKNSDKATLAQFAVTDALNSTFYVKNADQLRITMELAEKVDSKFLSHLAIYPREVIVEDELQDASLRIECHLRMHGFGRSRLNLTGSLISSYAS